MQHFPYQPLVPCANRHLQEKWDKASHDLHRTKVKSAQPVIDTAPPKTYTHLDLKPKKQECEERIKRENNILKEKISHIKRTTGRICNRNYYKRKSLGMEKRQLELLRISKVNEMNRFRLSQIRPHYTGNGWHEDWIKTLKMMDSIARYPRGRANQQKEQKKHRRGSSGCDEKQKTSADEHSPASNKKDNEEKMKKDDTEMGKHKESAPQPSSEPDVPEKSISPTDTPEDPGSSDTI